MTDGTIDPKLNHLVRKCLSLNNDESKKASIDEVTEWLRKKYREYQRKDVAKLRRQVQTILTGIEEKLVEDEYDKEAHAHDEQRSEANRLANGLNASLTKRYRELQQGRDAEEEANLALQAAEASDLNETNEVGATESFDLNNDTGLSKKRLREDPSNPSSATQLSLEKRSSKFASGGKSTKRKKPSGTKRNLTKSGHNNSGIVGKDGAATLCEPIPRPTERYKDLGGMGDILTQIRQLIEYPLVRPELYRFLGVDPPRGVLLRGPPG